MNLVKNSSDEDQTAFEEDIKKYLDLVGQQDRIEKTVKLLLFLEIPTFMMYSPSLKLEKLRGERLNAVFKSGECFGSLFQGKHDPHGDLKSHLDVSATAFY